MGDKTVNGIAFVLCALASAVGGYILGCLISHTSPTSNSIQQPKVNVWKDAHTIDTLASALKNGKNGGIVMYDVPVVKKEPQVNLIYDPLLVTDTKFKFTGGRTLTLWKGKERRSDSLFVAGVSYGCAFSDSIKKDDEVENWIITARYNREKYVEIDTSEYNHNGTILLNYIPERYTKRFDSILNHNGMYNEYDTGRSSWSLHGYIQSSTHKPIIIQ